MKLKYLVGAACGLLALAAAAIVGAQVISVPTVTAIGPNDLFQDIPNGAPVVGNVYATATQLGNYSATLTGNNPDNALIGGDFGTNLFAYGATVSTITTTNTYVANRWFAWSGTSTTIGGAQETAAADIPQAYEASLRITRTGSGVIQSCVAQVVESINSYAFQGGTAEFDFHALAGAGFSGASNNLQVYVATGTGTDEGSGKMAFGLNGGATVTGSGTTYVGAGAVAWTGQVNLGPFLVPITTSWARYTVAAPIPIGAKEVAVAICWTPVGASPTNDYFEFTGAQLTRNSALTALAGTGGAFIGQNDTRAKAFARRSQEVETGLQQRYFWQNNEASTNVMGVGAAASTTSTRYFIQNPVTMRTAPTPIATVGSLTSTGSTGAQTALTALAATANASTVSAIGLTGTGFTASFTAGQGEVMFSNSGTGAIGGNGEL
jgi:hypothetical protein